MTYVAVALLLGLVILVHELGHFLAAKAVGLPVVRFSLGLGPVLWSRTWGGTRCCLSAVPFGGYVLLALAGEKDYLAAPLWRRIAFSLAGPVANLLFALCCYAAVYAVSPGEHSLAGYCVKPLAWTLGTAQAMLAAIPRLFGHAQELSSLVGIVAEGGRFVGASASRLLMLGGYISVSLAVFNLLPLPPLDGGKIVCDILVRCRAGLARYYVPVSACGWLALIALMLYATIQDVCRYLA
ncbi:site-2 protease family protein [Solidesulfovibrio alcoholivorans]|uniref:site-2 protease family protein n=1 Tax=Solidesulfovibrio alcoholivorans TaxID=81406 RepID=UPI0004971F67|nr:site-2 protease family protein [Solidesulfovibrio alcoholivorans]